MKLRLYHHPDGARVAYREAGSGPGLVLLHSALLSHREFEPVVEHLADRYRLILPDLPLHGDSEDRPRHPYTLDWLAEVIAAFCLETAGPRPLVRRPRARRADPAARARAGALTPGRLVLMPNPLHRPAPARDVAHGGAAGGRAGRRPRADPRRRARPSGPSAASSSRRAPTRPRATSCATPSPTSAATSTSRARGRAFAKRWPRGPRRELLDLYPRLDFPVLLLWADDDRRHPLQAAEEALDLLPDAQLRVLSGTGFLMAYDDPVGVARELAAFCG